MIFAQQAMRENGVDAMAMLFRKGAGEHEFRPIHAI